MKKMMFAVMASVVVATLVFFVGGGCSKNEQDSEVTMKVSEITDSTALVTCEYSPAKSVSYKLFVCKATSKECDKSMNFKISGLRTGTRYEAVVISYDSEHKQVGSSVVNFMTTGEPENKEQVHYPTQSDVDSAINVEGIPIPDDGK